MRPIEEFPDIARFRQLTFCVKCGRVTTSYIVQVGRAPFRALRLPRKLHQVRTCRCGYSVATPYKSAREHVRESRRYAGH